MFVSDREALRAYLLRTLEMLPWVPESMRRTLHTSCVKTVRRLMANGWINDAEAAQATARIRETIRNRKPSRCGFEDHET